MQNTKPLDYCLSCGNDLREKQVYSFHRWAIPSIFTLLSIMFLLLDFVNRKDDNETSLIWSPWVILGIWILLVVSQFLRINPDYGWIFIPFGGVLFTIFFFFLDRSTGKNAGYLGFDWAWNVVIPFSTFVIFLPIIARLARNQPKHYEILEQLVEKLEEEN